MARAGGELPPSGARAGGERERVGASALSSERGLWVSGSGVSSCFCNVLQHVISLLGLLWNINQIFIAVTLGWIKGLVSLFFFFLPCSESDLSLLLCHMLLGHPGIPWLPREY